MRVAVYYNNKDVRLEERPVPQIGPGEILVKVRASGICGSDVMEWYRVKKAPLVLGHEIAGEIVETGKGVEKYGIGDRVFVSHHIPCNTCRYCLNGYHTVCDTLHTTNFDPGGFAEYLRAPQLNVDRGVFVLPDKMTFEEGTFVEPLGCVLRGLRLADFKAGQSILILGSGISGLLHVLAARALGAGRIITTDVQDYRLNAAIQFGADAAIHAHEDVPAQLRDVNDGRLADLVVVCAGALPVLKQALSCVDRGGTVLFFAPADPGVELPVPVNDFWRNGITLMPTYGASPYDCAQAIELIFSARIPVSKMITHRLRLDETPLGFELVAQGKESIKVIIEPHRSE